MQCVALNDYYSQCLLQSGSPPDGVADSPPDSPPDAERSPPGGAPSPAPAPGGGDYSDYRGDYGDYGEDYDYSGTPDYDYPCEQTNTEDYDRPIQLDPALCNTEFAFVPGLTLQQCVDQVGCDQCSIVCNAARLVFD